MSSSDLQSAAAGAAHGRRPARSACIHPTERGCKKGGEAEKRLQRLVGCIARDLDQVQDAQAEIQSHVEEVRKVATTLNPEAGSTKKREKTFHSLQQTLEQDQHPIRQHMAKTMKSFAPGLFVGGDDPDLPKDNYELERWFRNPKSHERRIHGHRHAGVRLVQEGPTLLPTLDAHLRRREPFTCQELRPYADAKPPACQTNAIHRRKVMRKARSKKTRHILLSDLEQRYLDSA